MAILIGAYFNGGSSGGGGGGGGGDITTGLIAWWKFDDGSGTTATDSSGNGNSATLQGSPLPTWVGSGKIGTNMLNFTGGTGGVHGPVLAVSTASRTIAAWVRLSSLSPSVSMVLGCDSGGYYEIGINSTGKLAVYFRTFGGHNVSYDGTGSNTLTTNTWYHVSATYNPSTGLVGYVNAAVDGTAGADGNMDTDGVNFNIGYDQNNSGRSCNGDIDDVRVYDRALTATDILTLYNYT